jgi:hypothetical protein
MMEVRVIELVWRVDLESKEQDLMVRLWVWSVLLTVKGL